MEIAVLAPLEHPISPPFAGGLERHTDQLIRGLAAAGERVTVFAHPDSELPEGVERGNARGGYRRVLGRVRQGSFSVLHNNSVHFLPTLLSWRMTVPVVTTLHTPPYRSLRLGAYLGRRSGRLTFVAISRSLSRRWAGVVGESRVIYNGIDPQAWPFSEAGRPGQAVWCGRIAPEKGVALAIESARLAGFGLDLAGPIHDREYFERRVRQHLGGRVHYHGHLGHESLARLIGQAAVGVFSSVWEEPFGLVLPEMLACGTPVAAFRGGATTEILTPAVGTVAARGDVADLARAIQWSAKLDRAACRRHATITFPLSRMIAEYRSLYRELAGG